jgi:hypothetical protein
MHLDVYTYVQTKLYDGLNRRKEPRYKYKTIVHMTTQTERDQVINGVSSNISQSGIKVITPHRFNTHELIHLSIGIKEDNKIIMSENFFGRIMSIHTKGNNYHYNIDLRGTQLRQEQVDLIMKG